jgi:hypothetical protein
MAINNYLKIISSKLCKIIELFLPVSNFKPEFYSWMVAMKITAETNASDALKASKKMADIFNKYKLPCTGCKGIKEETIGRIAFNNGLDQVEFIADLNSVIEQAKK